MSRAISLHLVLTLHQREINLHPTISLQLLHISSHLFHISSHLLSSFLSAELLSTNGDVMVKSSQPCMLRFRSLPIRLARTLLMGVPLLLGISSETQKITIEILKHKEGYPRTEAIRVTMIPRAGALSLPQLYEAEILINSQLPRSKELVRNWKWTFYVWMSLYIYIFLSTILICCIKPLLFPLTMVSVSDHIEGDSRVEASKEPLPRGREDSEISESRKWRSSRGKRNAIFLHRETVGSSASSISVSREDMSGLGEEDVGDSESVCLGG